MVGDVGHAAHVQRVADGAVHLQANLHPVLRGGDAALAQRLADLVEGLLPGDAGRLLVAIGAHLDAAGADVPGQLAVALGALDVGAHHRRIEGVVLEGGAQPDQLDRGVREAPAHLRPLLGGEAVLHAVGVLRAQLDAAVAQRGELLDQGGHIPVLPELVGDQTKLHSGCPFSSAGGRLYLPLGPPPAGRAGGSEGERWPTPAPTAATNNEAPSSGGGDPARPRFLGLWVAGILLFTLFAGAMGVVTDVLYKLALGK